MIADAKGVPSGLNAVASGAQVPLAVGAFNEVLTGSLLPSLAELAIRGLVFAGCTATSGVAPGTAIGTTAPFTLANPAGSGKLLVVLRLSCAYISGTLGTGTTYLCANTNPAAAAVAGTAIPVTKTRLSSASAGNVGLAFTTATIVSPTIMRPVISLTPILATSVVAPYLLYDEDVQGSIVIEPGCSLSFESVAGAGTSPLVTFGAVWAEVPA